MKKTNVFDRLRKAEQSPAWNRAGAYAIMRGSELVGKILCKYPTDGMGPLEVFLWDWSGDRDVTREDFIQRKTASGMGYDKLAAALSGLTFGEIVLRNHPTNWKDQIREAGYNLIQVI